MFSSLNTDGRGNLSGNRGRILNSQDEINTYVADFYTDLY